MLVGCYVRRGCLGGDGCELRRVGERRHAVVRGDAVRSERCVGGNGWDLCVCVCVCIKRSPQIYNPGIQATQIIHSTQFLSIKI